MNPLWRRPAPAAVESTAEPAELAPSDRVVLLDGTIVRRWRQPLVSAARRDSAVMTWPVAADGGSRAGAPATVDATQADPRS